MLREKEASSTSAALFAECFLGRDSGLHCTSHEKKLNSSSHPCSPNSIPYPSCHIFLLSFVLFSFFSLRTFQPLKHAHSALLPLITSHKFYPLHCPHSKTTASLTAQQNKTHQNPAQPHPWRGSVYPTIPTAGSSPIALVGQQSTTSDRRRSPIGLPQVTCPSLDQLLSPGRWGAVVQTGPCASCTDQGVRVFTRRGTRQETKIDLSLCC